MRQPLFRATALLAILTALVAASALLPARTAAPGRDRILRVARAGPQRLESPDGPIHSHEETDAVTVPAGDLVEAARHVDTAPHAGTDQAVPPAIVGPAGFPVAAPGSIAPRPWPRRSTPARAGLERHAPDRAPPIA